MSDGQHPLDVVIIGGGIVGIATAALLSEAGRHVTIVDRTGICEETSSGNAAALAFSDILPLAQKGMMRHLPRWLADPLGPLAIRPSYLPRLVPWLYRFWRAGHPRHFNAALSAQAALMQIAEKEWTELAGRAGLASRIRADGALELYETAAEFAASLPGWAMREQHGIAFRHVEGTELADLQPGLSPIFVKGTFVPRWRTVDDPKLFGKAVWAFAEQRGARFEKGDVTRVQPGERGTAVELNGGRTLRAAVTVIAAGAWSHRLARQLGDRIPLETERGYNTTLPISAFPLRRQLIFGGHGFVMTPLATGLRIGGAVEFGGLDLPPNFARADAMLQKAKRFLPELDTAGGRQWMGYRPSLPDSLPVIGAATRSPAICYAFGHGHLGLTQAAGTARLIAEVILGQTPSIDLTPFSPRRFAPGA